MAKFNVVFSDDVANEVQNLAERRGTTKSQVLREAISLMKWFEQTQDQGSKIVVEAPDGKQREVLPLR